MNIIYTLLFVVAIMIGVPMFLLGTIKTLNGGKGKLSIAFCILGILTISLGIYVLMNNSL